ncbi:MAG: PA0069 family radical SAM protein [Burkholderiales bacterium]
MALRTLSGKHVDPQKTQKGRGAAINPEGRFEKVEREAYDDGWTHDNGGDDNDEHALKTQIIEETAASIITRNQSPDIPFTQSINPYQGCEHGCIYCYARPTHAYRNLSPGVDFETRIFAKVNAAELLRKELSKPGYRCEVISLGANTDPYQPAERKLNITRGILQVCAAFNQPVGIITKNAMVERDLDILVPMAQKRLVNVHLSVNNLDHDIARRLEPRCSAPARRLQAIRALSQAGVPVGVLVAPVIPFLNDDQIEAVLEAAYEAGATQAGYVVLRLPYEVKALFRDWLERHYPLKAKHVMSRVHELRGGRDNDPNFGTRMRGQGEFAELLSRRFAIAKRRIGFDARDRMLRNASLDTTLFRAPLAAAEAVRQMPLF